MKSTLVSTVVVAISLIAGCDGGDTIQSSLSSADGAITLDKKVPTICETKIDGIVREPIGFNSYVQVVGSARYSLDPAPVKDKYEARLEVSAELIPFWASSYSGSTEGCGWMISGVSTEYLPIKANSWTIVKRYKVEGRDDNAFLEITFSATTECVNVTAMRFLIKARPAEVATD